MTCIPCGTVPLSGWESLLERHEAFLECRETDRPLVGRWRGGYYPAEQFPQGARALSSTQFLRPEELVFVPFAADYENLYQGHRAQPDDFFYVGSPYWGIPWLEAILGCPAAMCAANCRAEPFLAGPEEIARLPSDLENNPWFDALLRFTRDLVEFAAGRFPVCPPLLRGPGDAACALLGGEAFVTGLVDAPNAMRELLARCARIRTAVVRRLDQTIPSWHGTHAAGGYPSKVWSRRTVAYYQEDCAALLNPRLFRDYLLPPARQACRAAEVNFFHLHSACLYPVDILLKDASFDVLEINLDHEGAGPPVSQLIPTFRRIQATGRPLVLWGNASENDWELILRELRPSGLSIQPFAIERS
jgi:hypothetical protein